MLGTRPRLRPNPVPAAVVLDVDAANALQAAGLTDSKKLTPRRRAALVPRIEERSLAWALGQASAREIDGVGIRGATELAMLRALQRLSVRPRPKFFVDPANHHGAVAGLSARVQNPPTSADRRHKLAKI